MQGVRRFRTGDVPEPLPPSEPIISQTTVVVVAEPAASKPQAPGPVDGATINRLRAGKAKVDARIDLHGLHQKEAFSALMRFLDHSVSAGHRSLLVITGKGAVAQGGGVLRRNVPAWVMASPFAARILTIQTAHFSHGGDGAFYVVLRRRR